MNVLDWACCLTTAVLVFVADYLRADRNHWRRAAEEALDTAERATKLVAEWRSEAHRRIYQ